MVVLVEDVAVILGEGVGGVVGAGVVAGAGVVDGVGTGELSLLSSMVAMFEVPSSVSSVMIHFVPAKIPNNKPPTIKIPTTVSNAAVGRLTEFVSLT